MTPRRTTEGQAIFTAGIVVLGCLIGLLAVSNDSYWIDESSTVHKAIMPTLAGWWERLRGEATSNMQLPLYLLYGTSGGEAAILPSILTPDIVVKAVEAADKK